MSNSTVTLGVGNLRHVATRTTASVVVAAVVMALMPARESTVSPAVRLSADSTALIMGGTTIPTPDDYYVGVVKNQYIAPTHPNQNIDYVAVTTPEETWPITGINRLLWLATGPVRNLGAWWRRMAGRAVVEALGSIRPHLRSVGPARVKDLEDEMAVHGNDDLVIYGYSQGAVIANREKKELAEQYPAGTEAPTLISC